MDAKHFVSLGRSARDAIAAVMALRYDRDEQCQDCSVAGIDHCVAVPIVYSCMAVSDWICPRKLS